VDAAETGQAFIVTDVVAWSGVIVLIFGLLGLIAIKVSNGLSISEFTSLLTSGTLPASMTARNAGLPIAGLEPENAGKLHFLTLLGASVAYYLMPVFCLTYGGLAGESRYLRVGLLEIMRQDYIRTARAKGLKGWQVIMRHAIPNALT